MLNRLNEFGREPGSVDEIIARTEEPPVAPEPASLRMLSHYDPYGWMAKIGLIVPASNTVNSHEWSLMAPEGISIHTARAAQSGRSSRQSFERMNKGAEDAAEQLGTAGVDILAYGCTSGSFMGPRDDMMRRLSERAGCPATNSAESVLAALKAFGVKTVALATPYMPYINDVEVRFLEEEGFAVCASLGLGLGETEGERFAIRKVPPEAVFRMARAVDRPEAEAIFISCTSLATLRLIDAIEEQTGKPVVTSNQATFWNVLRMLNLRVSVAGAGRLLREF
jgi:maleate cis-trans isomerase